MTELSNNGHNGGGDVALKRAILAAALLSLIVCQVSYAKLSYNMMGSAIPKVGFAPHIGRVYWTPGDKATQATGQAVKNGPQEFAALDAVIHSEARKARCQEAHAEYVEQHGFTTPRPLKGYSGCAKWMRNQNYWKSRRGERPLAVTSLGNQIAYTAHNIVLPW